MPLYSDHITNMYFSGGTPSYSAPYYSSASPTGLSFSASYLNPGASYNKHSSLGGYSRAPISSRWTTSSGRNYAPLLSTISERGSSSPVRIASPRRIPISNRSYQVPSYTSRPININTADIDVSRDRYRSKSVTESASGSVATPPAKQNEITAADDITIGESGPFMPRIDGKPETGIDSSPGQERSTIKRGRTVVRFHTIKRKERDSPRKPVDQIQVDSLTVTNVAEEEAAQGWRERLSEDLIYKNKREKKTLGEKMIEKFIVKAKSEDDDDITAYKKDSLKRQNAFEGSPPPFAEIPSATILPSKSPDRRCSVELLEEQANLLDSLIRRENLSTATLDLTKVGVEEEPKSVHKPSASIKRRKSSNDENPLQTTKSDHSLHDRMKSFRDSKDKHFSKRQSLKKSSSGSSIGRLDSITEFPKDDHHHLPLPSIDECRQPIKNENSKPKLKPIITATVEILPPSSPIKFTVDNITVEEKSNLPKKEILYSSSIDEASDKKEANSEPNQMNGDVCNTSKSKKHYNTRKRSKVLSIPEDSNDAHSPEPDTGNFWDKIGKRETVYLMKRKELIADQMHKNRRAMFWFPEDDEFGTNEETENDKLKTEKDKTETIWTDCETSIDSQNNNKSSDTSNTTKEASKCKDVNKPEFVEKSPTGNKLQDDKSPMGNKYKEDNDEITSQKSKPNFQSKETKIVKEKASLNKPGVVDKSSMENKLNEDNDKFASYESKLKLQNEKGPIVKIKAGINKAELNDKSLMENKLKENNDKLSSHEPKPKLQGEEDKIVGVKADLPKVMKDQVKVGSDKQIKERISDKFYSEQMLANNSVPLRYNAASSSTSNLDSIESNVNPIKILKAFEGTKEESNSAILNLVKNETSAEKTLVVGTTPKISNDSVKSPSEKNVAKKLKDLFENKPSKDSNTVCDSEKTRTLVPKVLKPALSEIKTNENSKQTSQTDLKNINTDDNIINVLNKEDALPQTKTKLSEKIISDSVVTEPHDKDLKNKPLENELQKNTNIKVSTSPQTDSLKKKVVEKSSPPEKNTKKGQNIPSGIDLKTIVNESPKTVEREINTTKTKSVDKNTDVIILSPIENEKEEVSTIEVIKTDSVAIPQDEGKEEVSTIEVRKTDCVAIPQDEENVPQTTFGTKAEDIPETKITSPSQVQTEECDKAENDYKEDELKPRKPKHDYGLKVPPKKVEKDEAPVRPLIATPRPLQKKSPQIIPQSSSSESSSESSDGEEADESSEESGEFFECENNPDGRTSTGSNDSGFDSSAPASPAGFLHIKKGGDATPSTSGAPTNIENATEVLEQELEASTAYGIFRKTGRFTPPARSIPRFRKYNIEDFHFIKVLGKGSFGKVLLAELRETEYYYAVKCLKKDVVLEDDDVECTLIERKVLALGTNHPFLCHLFATFQTDSHLFFVMEYLNGGDLMFHIQQSGRFPESQAKFYAAEIVSGLKFLHKRGIVYRDLKLDNILLDYEGHVRIADFGMCKLQIFLDKTADTFCGTPDYMAPEIIKGLKYNQTVDWWSFGVLLYEMLIGQSPFSGCDEDELFWSICNEMPSYPRFLTTEALTILTRLLDKDARSRLGGMDCMHGDVREQDFFHSIHWDRLDRRELESPFKPRVRHPLDTQYFDRAFTGERPRLTAVEPQVLRSMDQEPFRGFSYTNPNATDR